MVRSDSTPPDPVLLAAVAAQAQQVAETLSRTITSAAVAGVTVDGELFECAATITSWAAWLGRRAEQAAGRGAPG